VQKVRTRGCIDLTDSGLRVKTRKGSPHEDTVNEARSHQSEIYRRVQTGGAGVMAGQRPQRGGGRSRNGCHYTRGEIGVGPHFLHFFIDPLWVEPGSVCESCRF